MIGGCGGSALAAFYTGLTSAKGIYIKARHETSVRRIHLLNVITANALLFIGISCHGEYVSCSNHAASWARVR